MEYYLNTFHKFRVNDFLKFTNMFKELYPNNPGSVIYGYLHHSQEGKKKLMKCLISLMKSSN